VPTNLDTIQLEAASIGIGVDHSLILTSPGIYATATKKTNHQMSNF